MIPSLGRFQLRLAVLAAWLLFAAPSLCLAGLLEHACDCEGLAEMCDCTDECDGESDGECDGSCSHDGCTNDPCENRPVTRAGDRLGARENLAPRAEGPFGAPSVLFAPGDEFSASRRGRHFALGPPGTRRLIPCHPSDLPLLL